MTAKNKLLVLMRFSEFGARCARAGRRALAIATAVGLIGLSPALAATGAIKGAELRATISGRTVLLKTGMGFELPIAYRSNGTMAGRVEAMTAALVGASKPHDRGRWWITERQLCQRWSNWLDGKTYCFDLERKGKLVYWRSTSGHSGTARIR